VKKLFVWLLMPLLLAGCAQPRDFETMADTYQEPEVFPSQPVSLVLPPEASVMTVDAGEGSSLYICDGYTVTVQTFRGGDLRSTLRAVTGYDGDQLSVMSWQQGELTRHECVWTAAGEGGDQVGRTMVLDTGDWHYTLTVMADADSAGKLSETWQEILDSFHLGREVSEKG
jgi:hypothetical protein